MKHFLSLKDYSEKEILEVFSLAEKIKSEPENYADSLKSKNMAMIFQGKSTRTRTSFEAGISKLGGHAVNLDYQGTHLDKARLKDEIRAIQGYFDFILARIVSQKELEEISMVCTKSILINGLTDKFHPCQALADFLTIQEHFGKLKGLTLTFVGDAGNVCNSLIIAGSKLGLKVKVACPENYFPLNEAVEMSNSFIPVEIIHSAEKAIVDSDIVYTDSWISLLGHQSSETGKRLEDAKNFCVNEKLMRLAEKTQFSCTACRLTLVLKSLKKFLSQKIPWFSSRLKTECGCKTL